MARTLETIGLTSADEYPGGELIFAERVAENYAALYGGNGVDWEEIHRADQNRMVSNAYKG
jgi:hypothetical protein